MQAFGDFLGFDLLGSLFQSFEGQIGGRYDRVVIDRRV